MFSTRPILSRYSLLLAATIIVISPASPMAARADCRPALVVIDRAVTQERVAQDKTAQEQKWFWQTWQVDYRLRLDSPTGLIVTPAEIVAAVEGWVSNSRVPSHAAPRWSTLALSGASGLAAETDLIEATDESQRCRERAILQVWPDDVPEGAPGSPPDAGPSSAEGRAILSLAPGATVRVRLSLIHQHFLYGMYDPLLGRRTLVLHLGPAALHDTLPLDREHHVTQATSTWATPPEDRRDTRQFVSAPDSLHLEAHIPGFQYYRFPEQPVRYGTRMRLQFWYLIAPGTEGECKARIAQYKDTPTTWKVLSEGGHEQCLTTVGQWVRVERVFRTEPDATTLALDFRIVGADVGELWIDDVSLEPLSGGPGGP
jgi:hypothetical protein